MEKQNESEAGLTTYNPGQKSWDTPHSSPQREMHTPPPSSYNVVNIASVLKSKLCRGGEGERGVIT